jgi:biopolymer transport protein ExbD
MLLKASGSRIVLEVIAFLMILAPFIPRGATAKGRLPSAHDQVVIPYC